MRKVTFVYKSHYSKLAIDNHSSGYLGMAVQHCVRAYLGPYRILAEKQYCQKLMAQLTTAFFFNLCNYVQFEAIKLFMKNSDCLYKYSFVLTD